MAAPFVKMNSLKKILTPHLVNAVRLDLEKWIFRKDHTRGVSILAARRIIEMAEAEHGKVLTDVERVGLMGFPPGHRGGCKCDPCRIERERIKAVSLYEKSRTLQRKQTVRKVLPKSSPEMGGQNKRKRDRPAKISA